MRQALATARPDIAEAYLFGSVLDPARSPQDIDLLVVTADGAGGAAWRRVRMWRESAAREFQTRFGLPLSLMIATPSEWQELDGTSIRGREPLM